MQESGGEKRECIELSKKQRGTNVSLCLPVGRLANEAGTAARSEVAGSEGATRSLD